MKSLKSIVFYILLIMTAAFAASCDNGALQPGNQPVAVLGIRISPTTVEIGMGDTMEYTVSIIPENADNRNYTLTSDNEAVATVSEAGILTAVSVGNAKITVLSEDGGCKAVSHVTVVESLFDAEEILASIEMILVEGDTFEMGATPEQGKEAEMNEEPVHRVALSDFYIGKYEVTQAQWKAVMGDDILSQHTKALKDSTVPMGARPSDEGVDVLGDNYPMFYVNWNEASEFIARLNEITGKEFRLLTEAEWEYAARGGSLSEGYKYSGSNDIDEVAWYNLNSGASLHEVGSKKANELGIYDMSGNVWEWVSDYAGYYSDGLEVDPTGPAQGDRRILRGGSCANEAKFSRVSARDFDDPTARFPRAGFRLAMSTYQ